MNTHFIYHLGGSHKTNEVGVEESWYQSPITLAVKPRKITKLSDSYFLLLENVNNTMWLLKSEISYDKVRVWDRNNISHKAVILSTISLFEVMPTGNGKKPVLNPLMILLVKIMKRMGKLF